MVEKTEKYSSWLVEGLKSEKSSIASSPSSLKSGGDSDFEPCDEDGNDDEATIEEEEEQGKDEVNDELAALQRDSEVPIEELLGSIPSEMLKPSQEEDDSSEDEEDKVEEEMKDESQVSVSKEKERKEKDDSKETDEDMEIDVEKVDETIKPDDTVKHEVEDNQEKLLAVPGPSSAVVKSSATADDADDEFKVDESEAVDDEETLDQEENLDDADHDQELDDLQKEGEIPIEELLKMYGGGGDDISEAEDEGDEDGDPLSDESDVSEDEGTEGLLSKDAVKETPKKEASKSDGVPDEELNNAAATAESLQPKGFTLSTVQVKTEVPFLLRHKLREYQHIGLDWLVTMFEKQLNGILADEMGLGKTIQTISLLAHLACEEGIWGPHLIVVPTSVMLNWEFELKKWCPGFKILTYFGTQKERKLKRTGWSKPNAFHVCITSYKLVIQDHQAFRRRKWKYLILDEVSHLNG